MTLRLRSLSLFLALSALGGCASYPDERNGVRYSDGDYYSPVSGGYGDYYYAPPASAYPGYIYYGYPYSYYDPYCSARYRYCPSGWYYGYGIPYPYPYYRYPYRYPSPAYRVDPTASSSGQVVYPSAVDTEAPSPIRYGRSRRFVRDPVSSAPYPSSAAHAAAARVTVPANNVGRPILRAGAELRRHKGMGPREPW